MKNKRFNIDVSEDDNGLVDISLSTNQDFNSNLEYDEIVKRLKDVFDTQTK